MTERRTVDHQAHWYPEAALKVAAAAGRGAAGKHGYIYDRPGGGYSTPLAPEYYRLDLQLQSMDEHGIDVAVLSANLLGDVDNLEAQEAQAFIELLNEQIAAAQREHQGRIAGLAMLPMTAPELALETLDRAIGELDLRGVSMLSNIGGAPIYNDDLLAVYRRIDELGVPLYLHPHNVSMVQDRGLDAATDIGAGWMLDTTAAALTLVYRGVLDACPNLTVVHPHAGGFVPYVHGRVTVCEPAADVSNQRPLLWYLQNRFFADSATDTHGALALAVDVYGADRVVFGTDWPWYPHDHPFEIVAGHPDEAQREAILRDNLVTGLRLPD